MPDGAYRTLVRSLAQAALVSGLGMVALILVRHGRHGPVSLAMMVMTADLAAANARYVVTVPQSVLESEPEVLRIIRRPRPAAFGRGLSASIGCRPGTR